MKILLLSCSTGEGHNSAAKAVMTALKARGVECEFIDPIQFKSVKRMNFVAELYNKTIRKIPWFFGIVYKAGKLYDASPLPSPVAYANSKYSVHFNDYVEAGNFDAIVSSHIFCSDAVLALRKKHGNTLPLYTIMTDYTPIPFYRDAKDIAYHFISCENIVEEMVRQGFKPENMCVSGIPIDPKFNLEMSKDEAKGLLGIPKNKRVIVILSGGAGCGKIVKLVKKLEKRLCDNMLMYIFVGKNTKLKEKLTERFSEDSKIRTVDFTLDVNIYLKAADVVMSKPGGLSSTEIAVSNVPFVHLKAIPGCESYNIRYFTKNGISLLGNTTKRAVDSTLKLLSDSELCNLVLNKQREHIPKRSADLIAEKIISDISLKKVEMHESLFSN